MPVALAATVAALSRSRRRALLGRRGSARADLHRRSRVVRRIVAAARGAMTLMTLGLACVCLAAGGLTLAAAVRRARRASSSISRRARAAATFTTAAQLETRVKQLLGDTPYTLYQLADGVTARRRSLSAICRRTRRCNETTTRRRPPRMRSCCSATRDSRRRAESRTKTPPLCRRRRRRPRAAAASPQTFIVADPALEHAADAAVERLEVRGGDTVVATLRNAGVDDARQVALVGTDVAVAPVPRDGSSSPRKSRAGTGEVIAYFKSRDRWPKRRPQRPRPPPPVARKMVDRRRPRRRRATWIRIDPAKCPDDLADYLAAGVIVLDNVAADALRGDAALRLHEYVRDLGGGIVILGGDRAFAAGGYAGTSLEHLSPLASTPPKPAAQWLLLADSSGSMARRSATTRAGISRSTRSGRSIPRLPAGRHDQRRQFCPGVALVARGQDGPRSAGRLRARRKTCARTARPISPPRSTHRRHRRRGAPDATAAHHRRRGEDRQRRGAGRRAGGAASARQRARRRKRLAPGNPLQLIADRTGGRIVGQSDPRQWAARTEVAHACGVAAMARPRAADRPPHRRRPALPAAARRRCGTARG